MGQVHLGRVPTRTDFRSCVANEKPKQEDDLEEMRTSVNKTKT